MKKTFLTLALALLCGAPLTAQEATPAPSVVATALAKPELSYLTEARPASDARFYIYLSSASWCPPCRALMPKVVEIYPEIKAAGGEIILLCFDRTPQAGAAYVKKYGITFPSILVDYNQVYAMSSRLPGFTPPRGIPNSILVTPEGKALASDHGGVVLNWKEKTADIK